MDLILLAVILFGLIGNALYVRFLIKRVADKISFFVPSFETTTASTQQNAQPTYQQSNGSTSQFVYPWPFPNSTTGVATAKPDAPAENEVMKESENAIDLENMSNLPSDLKFEVEGGDTQTPPGFEPKK